MNIIDHPLAKLDFPFEMCCHLPNAMAELIKHNNVKIVHPKNKTILELQNENSEMIASIRPNFKAAHGVSSLLETLNKQIFVQLSDIERTCKPLNNKLNVMFDECNSRWDSERKFYRIGITYKFAGQKIITEFEENKPNAEQVVGADGHFDEEKLQLMSKKQEMELLKNKVLDNTLLMNHLLGKKDEEEAKKTFKIINLLLSKCQRHLLISCS
ncbi:hypothetical protein PR048_013168 [Dryococelus australis]|uniref:Uncharacterized protein n=1 Tax=Dryococelus australis TaxID=614101 RepID=A0ABQ9HRE7_9NEOP|nr:hypothetical protein PR048_013168 [Dryococelus australis]